MGSVLLFRTRCWIPSAHRDTSAPPRDISHSSPRLWEPRQSKKQVRLPSFSLPRRAIHAAAGLAASPDRVQPVGASCGFPSGRPSFTFWSLPAFWKAQRLGCFCLAIPWQATTFQPHSRSAVDLWWSPVSGSLDCLTARLLGQAHHRLPSKS